MTYAAGMSEYLRTATERGVRTLTLDRPRRRNALSSAMITQLRSEVAAAVADPAVRVVVLDHTGPAFCSGVDLAETAAARDAAPAPNCSPLPAELLPDLLADLWVPSRWSPGWLRPRPAGWPTAAADRSLRPGTSFAFTEVPSAWSQR